ncbi:RHE_PE00001 family protein [Rhizobium oryzicola]|uniref:RHE_PE00001 family protein n=1 Tax=Rhizobium oryzicola TaxID=1232668 RepID=A0ABT8SXY8_9HYPH|nr:RHE_PE00001 family protein [Rhizobium oryzicola]MDO1583322.1 RHE_PE00001 family protein [Rhizobium oryzicola]
MSYDLRKLPLRELFAPVTEATAELSRLDERIARSSIGEGWIERTHFSDACSSVWVDGELVHLEDLVLHDAGHDIRAPTRELTIARDVLRSRRRIVSHAPEWALGRDGLASLRQGPGSRVEDVREKQADTALEVKSVIERHGQDARTSAILTALDAELASIDALLARSATLLENAPIEHPVPEPHERDPWVYDADWDEDQRLGEWLAVLQEAKELPPVARAVIALDAWNELQVLQHAPWLGRLLSGAVLREAQMTSQTHLVTLNLGLRSVPVERRRHSQRQVRLLAYTQALAAAAEIGLKEHDRLLLAHQSLQRRLSGRRMSSSLPQLIELAIARPVLSSNMIADALDVTPRAALRLVDELGLRELTGRGRFRAWGIV